MQDLLLRNGAHDRNRTGEPLPYQGSALPTELRGRSLFKGQLTNSCIRPISLKLERETRLELATSSLEGWSSTNWATPANIYRLIWKSLNHLLSSRTFEPFDRRRCSSDNGRMHNSEIQSPTYDSFMAGGGGRIWTSEGIADRFTVCSLWPLGNPTLSILIQIYSNCTIVFQTLKPAKGLEPPTHWLQISSSTNWATLALSNHIPISA